MTTGLHKNHSESHSDLTDSQVCRIPNESGVVGREGAAKVGGAGVVEPTKFGHQQQGPVGLRGTRWKRHTLAEKLESRITREPNGGCWNVSGADRGPNGYRHINAGDPSNPKKQLYAHRIAWELAYGPIPAGLKVLHKCDNPICANPEHLFIGTQGDNVRDCIQKGRRNAFGRQKLHESDVLDIRARAARGEPQYVIARGYGIAKNTVSAIVSGATWRHLLAPYEPVVQPLVNVEPVRFVLLSVKGELDLTQAITDGADDVAQFLNQAGEADGVAHV